MKNRTGIVLAIASIAVATLAWLLTSSSNLNVNADSHTKSPDIFEQMYRTEATDDLIEVNKEAEQAASGKSFGCAAKFDTPYLDLDVVAAELSKSDDPEHLLMAALFGPHRANEEGLRALSKALRIDPDNRLVLWNLLHTCSQFAESSICLDPVIENHAIEVDGSNGQLWARIAGFRIGRGNMPGALEALINATVAPTFSDYRMAHVGLFERGLAAAGNAPFRTRVIQAIGMQAALVSNELSVIQGCKEMAVESVEWLQQCLRFGERMEVDGKSFFTVAVGQSLQKNMLSISGDSERETSVEERLQLTRNSIRNGLTEDGQVLLSRDEQILTGYLAESTIYGEMRALEYLNEEVKRVKGLPDYNPCTL